MFYYVFIILFFPCDHVCGHRPMAACILKAERILDVFSSAQESVTRSSPGHQPIRVSVLSGSSQVFSLIMYLGLFFVSM